MINNTHDHVQSSTHTIIFGNDQWTNNLENNTNEMQTMTTTIIRGKQSNNKEYDDESKLEQQMQQLRISDCNNLFTLASKKMDVTADHKNYDHVIIKNNNNNNSDNDNATNMHSTLVEMIKETNKEIKEIIIPLPSVTISEQSTTSSLTTSTKINNKSLHESTIRY